MNVINFEKAIVQPKNPKQMKRNAHSRNEPFHSFKREHKDERK